MEAMEKKVSTDVIFSKNTYQDFLKCCSLFINNDYFYIKGNIHKKQIWSLPYLTKNIVNNEANEAIIKLAFETICNYEKRWTGSGLAFLKTVTVKNKQSSSTSEKIRSSSSFIISCIQKNLNCETTKNILQQIKKYGNPQLSISVQRSPLEKPIIKFISTPSIRLRVNSVFILRDLEHRDCKFFMVNGAVSTSSEITKLLHDSFENKETTYFLVCKSFNDEVLYTLKENYDRGITNVIPVEYGFDLDSINSLPDLQSIIGGLPFSADLGDVLSAADFSRLGLSDYVKIDKNSFTIRTSKNNKSYIAHLSEKIQESESDERKFLSKRLISLKGNACNIFLPENSKFDSVEINIRHATLMMHQMSKQGISSIKIGTSKFYIPTFSCTIIPELQKRVDELFKTKIYLPRR